MAVSSRYSRVAVVGIVNVSMCRMRSALVSVMAAPEFRIPAVAPSALLPSGNQ